MLPSQQFIESDSGPKNQKTPQLRLHGGDNLFCLEERIAYLKSYGSHSQHFTALQPGMQYFDVPGKGYIAFAVHLGRCMVLGDPVCDEGQTKAIIRQFHETHLNSSFVQVSESVAEILHDDFHYYATQFGQELRVPVQGWTTSGKHRKVIRKAINQAAREGITVTEIDTRIDVDDISADWLKTRKTRRNIAFMIRPDNAPYQQDCRYFYAWKDGAPIGFAYFDPAYRDGKIVGYLPNISRSCATFRQGLFYVLMTEAISKFQNEGIEYLDLGLCPLALNETPRDGECKLLRTVFKLTYRYCFHYNCRGLHFTKKRFGGDWTRSFLCHRNTLPVVDIWRLLRLSRIF